MCGEQATVTHTTPESFRGCWLSSPDQILILLVLAIAGRRSTGRLGAKNDVKPRETVTLPELQLLARSFREHSPKEKRRHRAASADGMPLLCSPSALN